MQAGSLQPGSHQDVVRTFGVYSIARRDRMRSTLSMCIESLVRCFWSTCIEISGEDGDGLTGTQGRDKTRGYSHVFLIPLRLR